MSGATPDFKASVRCRFHSILLTQRVMTVVILELIN